MKAGETFNLHLSRRQKMALNRLLKKGPLKTKIRMAAHHESRGLQRPSLVLSLI
jgi:hypothetical protein